MSDDLDLRNWRAQWVAQAPGKGSPAEARGRAVKQQRRLRTLHVIELLSGLGFLAFSLIFAWLNPGLESWLWAAIVWVSTLVASAFSIWNWNSLWKADAKSVSDFTEAYRKRCVAGLRAVRFGFAFLAIQLAISLPWFTWDYLRREMTGTRYAISIAILACFSVGFWAVFARQRRNAKEELNALDASLLGGSEKG